MKKIIAVIILIAVGAGTYPLLAWNNKPGRSEKIGMVVKLSEQGRLWTITKIGACITWEAQLIRGGMDDGSGAFGVVPFDFTVPTEELVRKVEHYMRTRTEVIIKYSTEYMYFKCNSDSSGVFLTSIEPIEDAAKKYK